MNARFLNKNSSILKIHPDSTYNSCRFNITYFMIRLDADSIMIQDSYRFNIKIMQIQHKIHADSTYSSCRFNIGFKIHADSTYSSCRFNIKFVHIQHKIHEDST